MHSSDNPNLARLAQYGVGKSNFLDISISLIQMDTVLHFASGFNKEGNR